MQTMVKKIDYKKQRKMTELKEGKIFLAKEGFEPLYRKGDKFKIIKINDDPDLMPIEAVHLRTGNVYGFSPEEI